MHIHTCVCVYMYVYAIIYIYIYIYIYTYRDISPAPEECRRRAQPVAAPQPRPDAAPVRPVIIVQTYI